MKLNLRSFFLQKGILFKIGLFICAFWIVIMIFAPYISNFDPLEQNLMNRFSPPSSEHIMGTDELGRDIFSRVVMGSQVSLSAGLITVFCAFLFGIIYGGIAGYCQGVVDDVLMRFAELVMSFPPLILAMVIAAALSPSILNSVFAMAIIWWPNYARLMRSMVITLKENEYVTAAKAFGASHFRILFKEILPNSIGPLFVMATLDIGNAILMFSGLSFIGLGTQPPTPEWGSMVAVGAKTFTYWWMSTFPGIAIFSVAIGANFVGDGLRDFLDPKMKNML